MPRRQRSRVCSICEPSLSFDHALVKDAVALLGRRPSCGGVKHIRIGSDTPSPTHRFTVAQRRQEVHQAMRGFGDGAPHDLLVLVTGHTEGKDPVAFREQTRRQI